MKKLSRDERFILSGEFYIFFLLGVYTLMVGALVPFIREEYGINYELSGYLVSANSIGMIAMSLIASYTAILFGLKRAYMLQHSFVIVGLVVLTVSGNPVLLLLGMAFIGLARGSTANYSNQIVNDISKSDSRVMNVVGVFFAFGACVTPFIVILFSGIAGNWKYANYGVSFAAAVGILLTLRMKIDREGIKTSGVKRGGLSFFRQKKYLVSLMALFCYSGMEISIIGWIVTYFMETQDTTTQFASLMATVLWGAMLAGRIVCSVIANRMTTAKLIFYLSIGVAVFMAIFVSNLSLTLLIIATVGLGLCMSGTYSTILANTGHIFSEYKLAFGYFFMLGGMGPVILPSVIGIISERYGIRIGIRVIAVTAVIFLVISIMNLRLDMKANAE